MAGNANPNVDSNSRPDNNEYRRGYLEGVEFQKERMNNLRRMIEEGDEENLHCVISRKVWQKANKVWQEENKSPNAYMSPEQLLIWITLVIPEMVDTIDWTNEAGYVKGYLSGKGIEARTGKETERLKG